MPEWEITSKGLGELGQRALGPDFSRSEFPRGQKNNAKVHASELNGYLSVSYDTSEETVRVAHVAEEYVAGGLLDVGSRYAEELDVGGDKSAGEIEEAVEEKIIKVYDFASNSSTNQAAS